MPRDSRINAPANPIPFSCDNYGYQTDISRGYPHTPGETLGSVVAQPLIRKNDGYTLWLEYVTDKRDPSAWFWLMWYDGEGRPTMPMSAVFDRQQLGGMVNQLISQQDEVRRVA